MNLQTPPPGPPFSPVPLPPPVALLLQQGVYGHLLGRFSREGTGTSAKAATGEEEGGGSRGRGGRRGRREEREEREEGGEGGGRGGRRGEEGREHRGTAAAAHSFPVVAFSGHLVCPYVHVRTYNFDAQCCV